MLQAALLLGYLADPATLRGMVRLRCATVDALTPLRDLLLTGDDTAALWALLTPVDDIIARYHSPKG